MWDRKFENKVWEARKHAYGCVLAQKLTRAERGWLEEGLGERRLHSRLAEQYNRSTELHSQPALQPAGLWQPPGSPLQVWPRLGRFWLTLGVFLGLFGV